MSIKLRCLYLVQHMLHQMKALQFYTDLGHQKPVLDPPVNGKIQGLFKAFECFSSTFQGKSNFQGLFKTNQYIQVLFKPVRTLKERDCIETINSPQVLYNLGSHKMC